MNIEDAIKALEVAVANAVADIIRATEEDDKTPLQNTLGLKRVSSLVGTGETHPDVVIFGDINRFKSLNDQFGHIVGDAAIEHVGELIKTAAKSCSGQAFRTSGDEFIILISRTSVAEFKAHLSHFESCTFPFEDRQYKTAMSFGSASSGGEIDFDTLRARAESACRIAKAEGDGKYVEWSEQLEQQAVERLRARCTSCGSVIDCTVPRQAIPNDRSLKTCPCCQSSLSDE